MSKEQAPSPSPPSFVDRLARSRGLRIALPAAVVAIVIVIAALSDLRPSLSYLTVRVLSGSSSGNYHKLVGELQAAAARERGTLVNVASDGSVDNVARLVAAASSCEVELGLVQASVPVPEGAALVFYGRFPKSESLFFLGRGADALKGFSDLRGKRISVGPAGGGTAQLVEKIFALRELASLGVKLTNAPLDAQIEMAAKGEVDLAAFVMDEDAELIQSAIREKGLEVLDLPHADVIARRFPFLRHGRIGAGQFDAVAMLPAADKRVFRVETWLVGNGCASRAQTIGTLQAVGRVFPSFAAHNREEGPPPGLSESEVAKAYFQTGPDLLDEYLPRIANFMPMSSWVQVVMAVSILFNLMGVVNRFRLWRIDAGRVRAEVEIARCFGPTTTLGDIARIAPEGDLLRPQINREIERVIKRLEQLAVLSRKYSLGIFCPMGGEMAYRYQESLMHDALAVLRGFRERWDEAKRAAGA